MTEERIRAELLGMAGAVDPTRKSEALAAIAAAVAEPIPRRRRVRSWLLALAVIAGLSLTPPGQALAGLFGDLVGIGDESSVTESDLRDPRLDSEQERVGPAIVTAQGDIPVLEEPFEILAWAARYKRPAGPSLDVGDPTRDGEIVSCMGEVFPGVGRQETGKVCIGPSQAPSALHVLGVGTAHLDTGADPPADAPYQVIGDAGPQARRIVVTYRDNSGQDTEVDATLGVIDDQVMAKTGAETAFSFFVAFLPDDGAENLGGLPNSPELQSVKVTAYDAEGRVLGVNDAGADYSRALRDEQGSRRTIDETIGIPEAAAQLAICLKYGDRLPSAFCTDAGAAAIHSRQVSQLASHLSVYMTDGRATVDLPEGGTVSAELKSSQC